MNEKKNKDVNLKKKKKKKANNSDKNRNKIKTKNVKAKFKKIKSLKVTRKKRKKFQAVKIKTDPNIDINYEYESFSSIIGSSINKLNIPILLSSIACFLLSYICRKYYGNYFFLFLIPMIMFLLFFYSFIASLQKKHCIVQNNGSRLLLSSDQLIKIQDLLPFNCWDPEVETANWINKILKQIWPYIQNHLNQIFNSKNFLSSLLGLKLTRFFSLRLKNASIGKTSPIITGIHVKRKNFNIENVIIDIGVVFNSDLSFFVEGIYSLKAGIEKFFLQTQIRIILSPLFHEQPSIGKIHISLISTPQLDWRFKGALWFLNISVFKIIASEILFYWFGVPSKVLINIAKEIPSRELKLKEPKGFVQVDIISASNLPRVESFWPLNKIRPYCVVKVEDSEKWTRVIKNTTYPEWNDSFSFLIHKSVSSMISFAVYHDQNDKNKKKDRLIGFFSVCLDTFNSKMPEINGRELFVLLKNPKTGQQINKDLPKISFKVSWFQLSNDKLKPGAYEKFLSSKLPVAVLSILVESILGLETIAKQIRIPELCSLVRISVGNSTQVTNLIKRTGCPVWDQALHFLLFNPKLEIIHFEVVDLYNILEKRLILLFGAKRKKFDQDWVKLSQGGIVLGYLKISAWDVFNSPKMKVQGSYRLEGLLKEAYIQLLVVIRTLEFSKFVEINRTKAKIEFLPNLAYHFNTI